MPEHSILSRLNPISVIRTSRLNLFNASVPETGVMALKQSGLFDASYYLAHNSDVLNAGVDPFEHYAKHGYKEGREPSPFFSGSSTYLKTLMSAQPAPMSRLWIMGAGTGCPAADDE